MILEYKDLIGLRVHVYRNLHKDCWSIRHKGKVIAHVKHVELENVEFRVQPAGNKRYKDTGVKTVHAYVVGTVRLLVAVSYARVKYNPKYHTQFMCQGQEIFRAKNCSMDMDEGVFI